MTSTRTKTSICNMALDILHEGPFTDVDTDNTANSRWFVRNYQETLAAELEKHNWKFAIQRRRLHPYDFALRGRAGTRYGALSGAWGMIRLIESWTGDLITVRRSTDSVPNDFGILFDEDNDALLDESGDVLLDESDIEDFLGGVDGYIERLYDQSGNGRHMSQATTTKQPVYLESQSNENWPAASFDGDDDCLATAGNLSTMMSTATGLLVIAGRIDDLGFDSATAKSNHLLIGDQGQKIGLYARAGGNLYGWNDDGSGDTVTDHVPLLSPFVATIRHEGGSLYVSVNGRDEVSGASGSTSSLASVLQVGDIAGSNAIDFRLFAALAYSTPPAEEERKRIVERLMRWVHAGGAQDVGWAYRYPKPADCLRLISVRTDGRWEAPPIPHEVEGDDILTNQASYIDVRYLRQDIDPASMPTTFVEALAARLAMKGASRFTGKQSMTQVAASLYQEAIGEARRSNAIEGTPERPYDDDVIAARYST